MTGKINTHPDLNLYLYQINLDYDILCSYRNYENEGNSFVKTNSVGTRVDGNNHHY